MSIIGAQRASELTGVSRSTIQRYMKTGKLSCQQDANGKKRVDIAELERVFGLLPQEAVVCAPVSSSQKSLIEEETSEIQRLRLRVEVLEMRVTIADEQIEDLKDQRDQWQRQATQVLLTSQHAQKEAQEYKDMLRVRQRREAAARKASEEENANLVQRLSSLTPGNQNSSKGFLASLAKLWHNPSVSTLRKVG